MPARLKLKLKYRLVDLCAGTGAFSWVFLQKKIGRIVYANDFKKSSQTIYQLNCKHPLDTRDLNQVPLEEIPDHDLLTAGFPCQGFSISGQRKGFQDTRSQVFWKIVQILEARQPKYFILENVKNLMTHDGGRSYATVVEALKKVGYQVETFLLDTAQITGVPQHRERVYLIGRLGRQNNYPTSISFSSVPLEPLEIYLQDTVPDKYYYDARYKVWKVIKEAVTQRNRIYQYRRYYVRPSSQLGLCPTLTCNMGSGGHNVPLLLDDKGVRKLTPRECFNLQGFPPDYQLPNNLSDKDLYQLAGNAVSVPVISLLYKTLLP